MFDLLAEDLLATSDHLRPVLKLPKACSFLHGKEVYFLYFQASPPFRASDLFNSSKIIRNVLFATVFLSVTFEFTRCGRRSPPSDRITEDLIVSSPRDRGLTDANSHTHSLTFREKKLVLETIIKWQIDFRLLKTVPWLPAELTLGDPNGAGSVQSGSTDTIFYNYELQWKVLEVTF